MGCSPFSTILNEYAVLVNSIHIKNTYLINGFIYLF